MKLILTIIIFSYANLFAFSNEYSLEIFGPELKIGITRLQGKEIFVNSENGRYSLIFDGVENIKTEGSISHLIYTRDGIIYNNKSYNKVEIKKVDIFTLLNFSKDGKNYSRYRGEFVLEYRNNMILPINLVRAEEYLYSVVPSEIGLSFHEEAIKAQAVAARTYMYHSLLNKKYTYCDMLDTVDSQVYLGYDREHSKITELVNETANEIMLYNGLAINALFHSTSGGRTANNEDVWTSGTPLPYIRAVNDKGNGDESPRQNWNFSISKKELSNIFGFNVSKIEVSDRVDGRAKYVKVIGSKTIKITGNELRRRLGYTKIFSTLLNIKDNGNSIYFSGHGSGHGLGMPQWSANGMAKKGKKYHEILKYFYTGIEIKKI